MDAEVLRYNPKTRLASALREDGKTVQFSTTCFYAGRVSRDPYEGEQVVLVYQGGTERRHLQGVWCAPRMAR